MINLLIGRPVEHVAVMAVPDAQHFRAVIVIAPGFAPQVGLLKRRHQHLNRAGTVHLLAHHLFDSLEDAKPSGSQE